MLSEAATLQTRPRLAPCVRLQTDPVTQAAVLLYPEGLLELNDSAREIVARCDGVATVELILETLVREYEAPREELLGDIFACLDDLHRRRLLLFE
jgi:pyrroloquinoline quinone biosynthesis protein D